MIRSVAVCLLVFLGSDAAPAVEDLPPVQPAADDWPWWRGPNRNAVAAPNQEPPVRWSKTENVVWKAEVPGRGHGSPTIWGQRIFLPAADYKAQTQYLLCYDRATGSKRWQTEIHKDGFVPQHSKNSHASSTPACDGQYVFITFAIQKALWLTALDLDGKIVWQKRLGDFQSMHGYGASPNVYKSLVIVTADNLKKSFLVAVHRRTGEIAWRTERPDYRLGNYASAVVGRVAGRDQLLIPGPYKTFSYDPADGKLLWTCDGPCESATSTITPADTCIYACGGFPKKSLLAIRADGSGDVTPTHILWSKKGQTAYVPSLLLADGLLYMVDDGGKTTCFEADSGKEVWKTELDGNFSSSPMLAGGHIYVANEAGMMFVFKPGRKFELVAKNDLGDGGFATPTVCAGRIYLRTLHGLYCLGK